MRWQALIPRRGIARAGFVSWVATTLLVVAIGVDPYAAAPSPLQLHGALQRAGEVTPFAADEGAPESEPGPVAAAAATAEAASRVGIISHRGAAAIAPENTLAAFRLAIEQGVDFIETDVQLTADGVPVLMHDPTLDRTTNGSGPVGAHTFEEVRALDAGGWFDAGFAGETVPTLEEFLALLQPAPTRAFIELKGEWTPPEVASVMELLRENRLVYRVVLESFEVPNLEMVQQIAPEFARMLLTRELTYEVLATAVELRASAVGAREGLYLENPEFVGQIRRAGMGAVVYTLNADAQWQRAAELGLDFVITDDPVSLAEWRSNPSFDG